MKYKFIKGKENCYFRTMIKYLSCYVLLILLASCGEKAKLITEESDQMVIDHRFQKLLDSANLEGAILVFDDSKGMWYTNDSSKIHEGHIPASTFKIPNSIVALELGIIDNDSTMIYWDTEPRRLKAWEEDLIFREAFHRSCVPCYQEIARIAGVKNMKEQLTKMEYPQMVFDTGDVDNFWLVGESRISPKEQLLFLKSVIDSTIKVSPRTVAIMKRMMIITDDNQGVFRGKTGWSIQNEKHNGWFIGCLTQNEHNYYVVTNVSPMPNTDMDKFGEARKAISLKALSFLGIVK